MLEHLYHLKRKIGQRLAHGYGAAIGFALIGALNSIVLGRLPELLSFAAEQDATTFFYRLFYHLLAAFVSALVVVLLLRLCTDSGRNMVRRPLRFLCIMAAAATLASPTGYLISHLFSPTPRPWLSWPVEPWLENWLEIMLWGGLFGWLYFLLLQKREDRTTFSALLLQRARLARQLAQSELLSARAVIDPDSLARVLRTIQTHQAHAPHEAAALLDQLIVGLRQAMGRTRPGLPQTSPEPHPLHALLQRVTELEQEHAARPDC
jgi:hypothetical protein